MSVRTGAGRWCCDGQACSPPHLLLSCVSTCDARRTGISQRWAPGNGGAAAAFVFSSLALGMC